jgi:methenyltetrahydrofolate cyclohydrolase
VHERTLGEILSEIGARTPAPASGSAAALTGALAAAPAELAGRFAGDAAAVARAEDLGARLLELAEEDAEAYADYMAVRSAETRARIVSVPEEIAAAAEEVASIADKVRAELHTAVAGDAEASGELARAAARVARRLVEVNLI